MIPESKISRTVMRRVRIIHAVRTYATPALASLVFVLALGGIGREVWVAKVFQNMPSVADLPSVLGFFAGAFLHTELVVQSLSIIALAALVYLARELALSMRSSSSLRHA